MNIDSRTRWTQNGITVAGGNGCGSGLNQLSYPFGLCVDDDQTIYIADLENDRIVAWEYGATGGKVVAGGNGEGDRLDQLNGPADVVIDKGTDSLVICDWQNRRVVRWPCRDGTIGQAIIPDIKCRGLAMDKNGCLYVSNWGKNEVRLWQVGETYGTIVAGANREGGELNQLSFPGYLSVDQDHSIYISDWNNHRVMKWIKGAKEGIVVAGGYGQGNDFAQLSSPCGLVVDRLGTVYIADCDNHRIMRWCKEATEGELAVGGNGEGDRANQLRFPTGLVFDHYGNLYVADSDNHRVQRFQIEE